MKNPIFVAISLICSMWVEWTQLEGIGDALARRIVADRQQNGPFRSLEELRRVKGIGPKTLNRLRPWIQIGAASAAAPNVARREH